MQDVHEQVAILTSIQNHLAMIMFDPQGKVIWVNSLFASVMGYRVDELINMHHRKFCLPEFTSSQEYVNMWDGLRQGRSYQDKIVRVTKDGQKLTLEATYMPVYKENNVKAIIKVATDITKRENVLQQSTTELMAMVEEMTASSDEVLKASKHLVDQMKNLNIESEAVKDQVQNIQSVTSVVKNIASQSNLLGLNAAIEAARAGEHGRGFNIVANEVRKMAESSKQSAENISSELEDIQKAVSSMMQQIKESTGQISINSNAIAELKKAYDHIATTTEKLASSL